MNAGKHLCLLPVWWRTHIWNRQRSLKTSTASHPTSQSINGLCNCREFSKYKVQMADKQEKQMFNHTRHQRCKLKLYCDFISPQSERQSSRKQMAEMLAGIGTKRSSFWWGYQVVQPARESVWGTLKYLETDLP